MHVELFVWLTDMTAQYLSQGWVTHGHTYRITSQLTHWHVAPTHTHVHTYSICTQGGSLVTLLWAEAVIVILVFRNTIPSHFTPGRAAVWHSAIWCVCVCVSAYLSVNDWMFGRWGDITVSVHERRKGVKVSDEDRSRMYRIEFIHGHTRDRLN